MKRLFSTLTVCCMMFLLMFSVAFADGTDTAEPAATEIAEVAADTADTAAGETSEIAADTAEPAATETAEIAADTAEPAAGEIAPEGEDFEFSASGVVVSGFYGDSLGASVANGIRITPKTADGKAVTGAVSTDVADSGVTLYNGSERLEVQYSGTIQSGEYYMIFLLEGDTTTPTEANIKYINQVTADADNAKNGSISFDVYPMLPEATTDMTLMITSNKAGFTTRTVKFGYYNDQGKLKLNYRSAEIAAKKTIQLIADTTEAVVWTSSDAKIATVSKTGLVKGVKGGECVIRVSLKSDPSSYAECNITVSSTLKALKLVDEANKTASKFSLPSGGSVNAYLLITKTDNYTKYKLDGTISGSDNSTVLIGSEENGRIPVTITIDPNCTDASKQIVIKDIDSGKSVKCTITVVIPATDIQLSGTGLIGDELKIQKGKTASLKAVLVPSTSKETVSWASMNPDVATVDAKGKIKAVGGGRCEIRVSTSKCCKYIKVDVIEYISKITVSGDAVSGTKLNGTSDSSYVVTMTVSPYKEGIDFNIDATVAGDGVSLSKYSWTKDDITDNGDGTGSVKLTVTTDKGCASKATITFKDVYSKKTVKCSMTIAVKATSLTLSKNELALVAGKTSSLKATLGPTGSKETVKWESSNPDIATVDAKGKIKAVSCGTCTITAETASSYDEDGEVYDECVVVVTPLLKAVKVDKITAALEPGDDIDIADYLLINGSKYDPADPMYEEYFEFNYSAPASNLYTLDAGTGSFKVNSEAVITKKTTVKITVDVVCGTQKKKVTATVTLVPSAALQMVLTEIEEEKKVEAVTTSPAAIEVQ